MGKLFYALYDLANSAYTIIVVTFITSAYFANQIVGNPQLGAAYWQWTAGLCGILVAVTGPLLGSLADKEPKGKINLLHTFTIFCVLFTSLFWFAKPSVDYIWYALIIFLLSNYFYEAAVIFYNSLLKSCSNENNIGKTSGFAFALGYIGCVPILLFSLYVFVLPDTIPFGLDKSKFENIRFIPVIAAIWFLIFSYPMINYFKHHIEYKENCDQTPIFKKLIALIWKNKFTSTGKFLFARMIYSDALIVLISGGGVYASGVFGFTPGELLKLAIFANLVAFVGVLLGGYLNDKISSKIIILTCIAALTLCVFYSSIIAQTKTQFFINVMVISLFIGSIQSASRVMMTGLLKADDQGSGFGLFSFSGRITAFAGPLLVGTMTFFYSQRVGLLSISIFFILGFILMLFVDKDQKNKKIP
ncbi:MFS transporter [Candidatus Pelagibacter sp.]|nr:MFS transporter [Candidatus Pelagibacter sp.]